MRSNDKSFKEKVVLITGASSGIGAALAKRFASEGAKLALLARREEKLATIVNECQQQSTMAIAIPCDVTQQSEQINAVDQVHQILGDIDVVIANAGFGVIDDFTHLTIADIERQFATNIYGVLNTVYACLADLKKTRGRLVLVGSALGHMVLPRYSAYCMSKYAITALAESLFIELAPYGISVTLISPGYIDTEFRNINKMGQYQEGLRPATAQRARMPADKAAELIIEAIRTRKREYIITLLGKIGVWVNRLFPGLLPRLYRRQVISKHINK